MINPHTLADSDWEHLESDTRYLTHNIHRFSGKFIPQIARQAIEILSEPGEVVLDPYCGSGTTLLEGVLRDRRMVGVDLNPLAVLISKVKVTPVSDDAIAELMQSAHESLASIGQPPSLFDSPGRSSEFDVHAEPRLLDPWFTKWFAGERLKELLEIDAFVRGITDPAMRRIGEVALSDVLRRSSNAHSSYPNVMFDKSKKVPPPVPSRFLKRLREVCESVALLQNALNPALPKAEVLRADASMLPFASSSVDAVVTHPPYIGSIPYAEYGSLSLKWFGYEPKEIDGQLTGGRRQSRSVVERFTAGYLGMLSECHRVLRPGRQIFLMVGDPTVRGERIDLTAMSIRLGEQVGFKLADQFHRVGGNRRANLMVGEDLLILSRTS